MNNVEQGSLFDGIDMENIPEKGVKYNQGCNRCIVLIRWKEVQRFLRYIKKKTLPAFILKAATEKNHFM